VLAGQPKVQPKVQHKSGQYNVFDPTFLTSVSLILLSLRPLAALTPTCRSDPNLLPELTSQWVESFFKDGSGTNPTMWTATRPLLMTAQVFISKAIKNEIRRSTR
jgi:hypothetical protein